MASERKCAANRRNSQKSTGPCSAAGKAAVAGNAVRHGLLAERALLPDEDEAAFEELRAGMHEQLAPKGALEGELVEDVAANLWRLRRIKQIEVGVLIAHRHRDEADQAEAEILELERYWPAGSENGLVHESDAAAYKEARQRLTAARAGEADDLAALGRSYLRDATVADGLAKLSRYETAIRNAIERSLRELERQQVARRRGRGSGGDRGPPVIGLPGSKAE